MSMPQSGLAKERLDRPDDARLISAAAEMSGKRFDHIRLVHALLSHASFDPHHDAGKAEAALTRAVPQQGVLDVGQSAIDGSQPLNGRHMFAFDLCDGD